MGSIPKPSDRKRAHRKIASTPAARKLYAYFVKPFIIDFFLRDDERDFKYGVEAFFSVNTTPITWYKVKESFKMPGMMWSTTSQPNKKITGTGNRSVSKGSAVIVRQNLLNPDENEIEFKDQVFVLNKNQFDVIKDKLQPIA